MSMHMKSNFSTRVLPLTLLAVALSVAAFSQSTATSAAPDPKSVPVVDGGIGTNADGKARFTGIPERVKHGLYFEASEGDRTAEAFDDPATTCKNQFTVVLRKKP
jgi:hypothetical protein